MAHSPHVREFEFIPEECDTYTQWLEGLLSVSGPVLALHPCHTVLRHHWPTAQKWASKQGKLLACKDAQLCEQLGLASRPRSGQKVTPPSGDWARESVQPIAGTSNFAAGRPAVVVRMPHSVVQVVGGVLDASVLQGR